MKRFLYLLRIQRATISQQQFKMSNKVSDHEIQIQKAITAFKNNEFHSIYAAAQHFKVSRTTLTRRLAGGVSHAIAHHNALNLTNAEESTLIRWILRYTIAGTPLTHTLLRDLAEHLRIERVRFASRSSSSSIQLEPLGSNWVYRFIKRHSQINTMYARQLEHARYEGATYERVERWFIAIKAKFEEHDYDLSNVWNMDESGFGIGEQQAMKVLIHLDHSNRQKIVGGKQEWVTDIECINAAGESLAPLLIFKGKHLNTRWFNEKTPQGWFWATSKNGWTSNELGLQWLTKVFEPLTRERAADRQRLLIADGHGSHIRADFIAYCMENKIDLLIMPSHCSHILQPLDIGVFSAFKRRHTSGTDAISRLSSQRIPRSEWIELFTEARGKALTTQNIKSGWRGAGLVPAMPMRVLKDLPREATLTASQPRTPPETIDLDYSLLHSSPPELVELSQSNKKFIESLSGSNAVVAPVHRYAERITRLCESQNATIAMLVKQNAEQSQLLRKRKRATKGKRIQLEGVAVVSSENIERVAREAEGESHAKRPRGRPRKQIIEKSESESEDN